MEQELKEKLIKIMTDNFWEEDRTDSILVRNAEEALKEMEPLIDKEIENHKCIHDITYEWLKGD